MLVCVCQFLIYLCVPPLHVSVCALQIETQRAYFRAVKLFQEECDKNEALTAQVAGMRK